MPQTKNSDEPLGSHKKERIIEYVLAAYLVVSVLADQITSVIYASEYSILWYCSMSALILAFGCLIRNKTIPSVIFLTAIVAQTPWILDFILELFGLGFGRSTIMWKYGLPLFITSTNLHIILIPISFYLVRKYGFAKNALLWTFLYGVVLLPSVFFFSEPSANVNCVFASCDLDLDLLEPRMFYFPYFLIHGILFWTIWIPISYFATRFGFSYFERRKHIKKR